MYSIWCFKSYIIDYNLIVILKDKENSKNTIARTEHHLTFQHV